jgi:copper chaperone CopZ
MRGLIASAVGLMVLVPLALAQGSALKCKAEGLRLCCKDCEKTVHEVLAKVSGVSEIACDRPGKAATFKARNEKVADEAVSALVDAGFFFQVSVGDKKYPVTSKASSVQGDPLVVRNVHACCDECEKATEKLFKGASVAFEGKGSVKDMTLAGQKFEAEEVLQTLHQAGLHGVVVGKK